MLNRLRRALAMVLLLGPALVPAFGMTQVAGPVSVADLVRVGGFGDPLAIDWRGGSPDHAAFEPAPLLLSPDGAHAAVIVREGDPAAMTNNATLLVYSVRGAATGTPPLRLAHFAAAGAYQPVALVRWLADSRTLVFAASAGSGLTQIYRGRIDGGEIEQLSHFTRQLLWFDISASGNRLVALFEDTVPLPSADPVCLREGCLVDARSLYEAEHGAASRTLSAEVQDVPGPAHLLSAPETLDRRLDFCDSELAGGISPDGRFALRLCRPRADAVPPLWGGYHMDGFATAIAEHNARVWRLGYIIDLATGAVRPWSSAPALPLSSTVPPVWIDGGHLALIAAGFEPLANAGLAGAASAGAFAVQLLDPASGQLSRIGWLDPRVARISSAVWDVATETFTIESKDAQGQALAATALRRSPIGWAPVPVNARRAIPKSAASLVVEQSANDRARLYAVAPHGRRRLLLDPNAWLDNRRLGRVEPVEWTAKDGRQWTGGIYYPPDYVSGRRYPLVIQTHGFDPLRFSLSGAARNFPGQALAARGVLVLQVKENAKDTYSTPQIWQGSIAGYEAAIDLLDKRGLIDPQRVGMIGWSASGPMISAMLTHSDYPVAAAAFTDTGVFGWWYDMLQGDIGPDKRFEGKGIGAGLANWLETAPGLNLERVRAPLLIWGVGGVSATWDWVAGLRSQSKPVELWALPAGSHDLYQVEQRLVSVQRLVDWFCFWLKGDERSESMPWEAETPGFLMDQYARWRALHTQQEHILREPRAPLRRWTSIPVELPTDRREAK